MAAQWQLTTGSGRPGSIICRFRSASGLAAELQQFPRAAAGAPRSRVLQSARRARALDRAVEQEVDQLLQELAGHGRVGEEDAEVDRRQEGLDQLVGVDVRRQLAAVDAAPEDSQSSIESVTPEAADLVDDVGRLVDGDRQ